MRRKPSSAPAPITGESDWRGLYRRKRMPFARKRRWVTFRKKVKSIVAGQVAPYFNVFVSQSTVTSGINAQTSSAQHTILGGAGGDLNELFGIALLNAKSEGPALGSTAAQNLRIVVTGWLAETVITNLETFPVFVDMYYWRCKKDVPTAIGQVNVLWAESLSDIRANESTTVSTTTLSTTDYGVTPFQGTQFAKHVQIWKKVRVKLAGGSVTQVEQRSGKNYYRRWNTDEHFSILRGCTEGILFVHYGAPSSVDLVARSAALQVVTNKNYTWRIMDDNRESGMHRQP